MGNHLRPMFVLVGILSVIAIGADFLSLAYRSQALVAAVGVIAQAGSDAGVTGGGASTPTTDTPAMTDDQLKAACDQRKKEAAHLGTGMSPELTQTFTGQNITEANKCTGAIFDPESAAAKRPASGVDPKKNPEAYKCVGESSRVTIEGSVGTIVSKMNPLTPQGTCETTYCNSLGVCELVDGKYSFQSFGGVIGVSAPAPSVPPVNAPINPANDPSGYFADSPAPSTPGSQSQPVSYGENGNPNVTTPALSNTSSGQCAGRWDCAPTNVGGLPQGGTLPADWQQSSLYGPSLSPGWDPSTGAPPTGSTFGYSGNYDATSGTVDPASVSAIPESSSAIQTSTPQTPLTGLHGELAESARTFPVERSMGAIMHPDGSVTIINGSVGDTNGVPTAAPAVRTALAGAEAGSQGVAIHTHTLTAIAEDNPTLPVGAILRGDQPMPTSPPSWQDMRGTIAVSGLPNGASMSGQVIDPSGVWSYKVDPGSSSSGFQSDYDKLYGALAAAGDDSKARAQVRSTFEADLAQKYPDLQYIQSVTDQSASSPYLFNDPGNRQQLIAAYKAIGINLSFTPHPPIARRP